MASDCCVFTRWSGEGGLDGMFQEPRNTTRTTRHSVTQRNATQRQRGKRMKDESGRCTTLSLSLSLFCSFLVSCGTNKNDERNNKSNETRQRTVLCRMAHSQRETDAGREREAGRGATTAGKVRDEDDCCCVLSLCQVPRVSSGRTFLFIVQCNVFR